MLDRFRDQYAAYKAAHPQLKLYALIDYAAMSGKWRYPLSDIIGTMPRVPLYGDTGLDDLAATGPFLIACPEPAGVEPLRVLRSLLSLAKRDNRFVSWLWTTHEVEPLVGHLQTLLHAWLGPDGEDAWFFFHQPAYLPVLHRTLPEETRRYMFGVCLAWWCLDYREALVELPGENLRIPTAWEAFPMPGNVVDALYHAGAPTQVRAWLQRARPEVLDNEVHSNEQLQQLAPLIEQAFGYGVTDKVDQGVYAAAGLLYGRQYDDHPALKAVLTQFGSGKTTLVDAYAALGDGVWQEVATTARQRAVEAAALAHQAKLRERGYVSMRLKVVNDTEIWRRKMELVPPSDSYLSSANLGEVDARGYEPTGIEIASARVPVPGTRVSVKWFGPMGESSDNAVVTGELPRAEGEGLAIVTFARNWRVYVSMHAEEPKPPVRPWW
ncbi:DUF4123 domain-containing protein [Paraburkholderia sprentiae]|uniref:DUF4123 domain-containing protein n=1 Tax=Paraburkholderia sprentiae TaxID=948107 RepID=UPI000414988C|nr:DUF4123 domain-containing protein [Paraburkholderia sprentiae]